ncbi:hypothetical protein C6P40_004873 [Pichia californica]|uniref:Uncharacterized protein n=1 Tax=Pichia californica TaxID=460514 RepID=A0A9P6WLV5_9ASCO|nr:hypothetical protein C6P42_002109 [[Candida] californica]KAG0689535.1 hypothetical protein C6P40_004873 [[Candida] californica]
MPRYFLEFVNLQNTKDNESQPSSILVTIKLFSNSLPNLTSQIAELFFNESKDKVSYKKSQVTRVISPEYIIQFGKPVRRNKDKLNLKLICDSIDEKFNKHIIGRQGLLCLAEKPRDSEVSIELFICFVPWGKYPELDGFIVIGECKEWKELRDWSSKIKVKSSFNENIQSFEIPSGDGVWINRCGRLLENLNDGKDSDSFKTLEKKRKKTTSPGKVRAIDIMFKKTRTK